MSGLIKVPLINRHLTQCLAQVKFLISGSCYLGALVESTSFRVSPGNLGPVGG